MITVQGVGNFTSTKDGVKCIWFSDKNDLKEEIFDAAVLEKIEKPQSIWAQT